MVLLMTEGDKEPEKLQVWVTWGGEFVLPPFNKAYVDVLI